MRIGLQITAFTYPSGAAGLASALKDIAQAADEAGFYSLWVMDHFFQLPGDGKAEDEMLEGYATLAYLAALTTRVKLGTLVTGVIYRYPGILIKTVTTLDVLSGGRAYFGIGAGWFEREALGLGVPFGTWTERFEKLEETLQIAHQMWSGKAGAFKGKHYQLEETLCVPAPLSRPHPPIMIGGMGEKKTMRLVAQYGDACNLFEYEGMGGITSRLETIKRNCDALGRDYNEIERTSAGDVHLAPAGGRTSVSAFIAHCRKLADAGIQHATFNVPNVENLKAIQVFAKEIIPAVADF